MQATTVRDTITLQRTRVLDGAPLIETLSGDLYQPTVLTYSWNLTAHPRYVEVLARKLKKDGTPGRSTNRFVYRLASNTNAGYRPAPAWVEELVVTDLPTTANTTGSHS